MCTQCSFATLEMAFILNYCIRAVNHSIVEAKEGRAGISIFYLFV